MIMDSGLTVCDIALLCKWLPTLERNTGTPDEKGDTFL